MLGSRGVYLTAEFALSIEPTWLPPKLALAVSALLHRPRPGGEAFATLIHRNCYRRNQSHAHRYYKPRESLSTKRCRFCPFSRPTFVLKCHPSTLHQKPLAALIPRFCYKTPPFVTHHARDLNPSDSPTPLHFRCREWRGVGGEVKEISWVVY